MVNSIMSFSKHSPDLMAEAERIVKPQYPTAVQVENSGTSSLGSAGTAEDLDQWKFVFTDIDGLETITLDYERGKFGKAVREARPWIKTLIKELPRNLPLSLALSSLRNAGYNEPFLSVTLRAPFPLEKAATYVFQMKKKTVYMDALGGEVTRVVEGA
jgi:hypothetical protein